MAREDKKANIPVHVAIIADGNRRWAREKGLIATMGHVKAGEKENIMSLVRAAREMGVKCFSIWGFSTDNWKRDKKEVDVILGLLLKVLKGLKEEAKKEKIGFRHIGRKDRLPREIVSEIEAFENETKNYKDFTVILCFDYGGRDEILRTVNKIIDKGIKKVDEKIISENLDTADIPDVDLIIRTGGAMRTSGFMPFQGAYAELYFTEVYFPDFGAAELKKAVESFGERQRRFGK